MGLKVKNTYNYELSDNLANFFSLPIEDTKTEDYSGLKNEIYELDIDKEEKADILNAISKFNSTNSAREKKNLAKEIESFKKRYDLD